MPRLQTMSARQITRVLTYAGFVLVVYELIKGMIVRPIKAFYEHTTFGVGMPFVSYEDDVLSRHKNEFEACLLYLRDFMEAIDSKDILTIQALRKHRNDLAHDLVGRLDDLSIIEAQQPTFRGSKAHTGQTQQLSCLHGNRRRSGV